MQDLKKVVAWQTNKIENFGLGQMPAGGRRGMRKAGRKITGGFDHAHRPSISRISQVSSDQDHPVSPHSTVNTVTDLPEVSMDVEASHDEGAAESTKMPAADASVMESEPPSPTAVPGAEPSWDSSGPQSHSNADQSQNLSGQIAAPKDVPARAPSAMSKKSLKSNKSRRDLDEDLMSEEDRPESALSASTSQIMRLQVEALAMALVSLANLLLAPPKLGSSNHARAEQKSELLEELGSLRHWVTHKTMPPGWDPSRLTTLALTFAHQMHAPREAYKESSTQPHSPRGQNLKRNNTGGTQDESMKKPMKQDGGGGEHDPSANTVPGAGMFRKVQTSEKGKNKPLHVDSTLPPLGAGPHSAR